MVKAITHLQMGDRYFLHIFERSPKYHGSACIWFRPEDSATEPYRAGVSLFKEMRPRVSDSVCRTQRHFSDWRSAEAWSVAEYERLRDQDRAK